MHLGNLSLLLFWPSIIASKMEGWSEPRLQNTYRTPASHRASNSAVEAVYMLSLEERVQVMLRMMMQEEL